MVGFNILTATLMAITAFLSCSPGLLNRGPGGPASLGHGPHSSIFSPTHLRLWTPTAQSGVLRAPSAVCWFSIRHLFSNWLQLPMHRVILLLYAHSIQPVDSQGYPLDNFDRMHLLFTQVHFFLWQLGRGQYATVREWGRRKESTYGPIARFGYPVWTLFYFVP